MDVVVVVVVVEGAISKGNSPGNSFARLLLISCLGVTVRE